MKESVELIYTKMKNEIQVLGWSKIIDKYHPDNNIDDANALERFKIYRGIYKSMETEAKLAYKINKKYYLENQLKQQSAIVENYKKTVNNYFYFSIAIAVFMALIMAIKNW